PQPSPRYLRGRCSTVNSNNLGCSSRDCGASNKHDRARGHDDGPEHGNAPQPLESRSGYHRTTCESGQGGPPPPPPEYFVEGCQRFFWCQRPSQARQALSPSAKKKAAG